MSLIRQSYVCPLIDHRRKPIKMRELFHLLCSVIIYTSIELTEPVNTRRGFPSAALFVGDVNREGLRAAKNYLHPRSTPFYA